MMSKNVMASGRVLIKEVKDMLLPIRLELVDGIVGGGRFASAEVLFVKCEQAAYIPRTVAAHLIPLNPSVAPHMI